MAGSNFVDYVKIFARSGHGGAGSAHFRREKFVAFGGPDGGDGGKGGSIVLQGDSQYWTLIHLKYQRHQFAEDGQCGSGARSSGKDAKDIVIPVPLGTVAKRIVTQEDGTETVETVGEVTADGERLVLLHGGRGGLGNWHFKSATNQTPRYAQPGEEGDEGAFILELKVLADVGLVGFPNAGKSTLLNTLTGAGIEANDRLFDTLDPTTRKKRISDTQEILLSDTVGFIRKLPHHLVSAFKATLEELAYADLLLHVVDVSDEDWQVQAETVDRVIAQLGAQDIPRLMVYNKADKCDPDVIPFFRPDEGVKISAKTGEGVDALLAAIEKALGKGKHRVRLCIPYSDGAVLDMLHREAQIESTDYAAEGTVVEAVVDDKTCGRVSAYIIDNE